MAESRVRSSILSQVRTLFTSGAIGPLTDGQLVERFVGRGDEAAFAALVDRHGPMVLGTCRAILRDHHAAEDAFQATFLVLARCARTIRDQGCLAAWLHRVARRVAIRARARWDKGRRREAAAVVVEEVAMPAMPNPDHGDVREVIDAELDRLRESHRLPVVLCYLEGLSHEEAAARLNWPVGTVKSRLARGRACLEQRLRKRGLAPAVAALAGGTLLAGSEATAAGASVSPALAEATVQAAVQALAKTGAAGVVPAVAALANEEIRAMFLFKLKLITAGALAVGTSLALAGAAVAWRPGHDGSSDTKTADATAPAKPSDTKKDQPGGMTVSASGRVVDAQGKPVAGAMVFVREWAHLRVSEKRMDEMWKMFKGNETIPDTLAKVTTDADGRFHFDKVPAPAFRNNQWIGKTTFPWDLVVLADGHGLGWAPLTPYNQRNELTVTLSAEAKLTGQVVEPSGQPIAGVQVRVFDVEPLGLRSTGMAPADVRLDLNWSSLSLGATTDESGHFTIGGLPSERCLTLDATAPGHQRAVTHTATSDQPQPDRVDQTYNQGREEVRKIPVQINPIRIAMKTTDHRLLGRAVNEDGSPVVGATVMRNYDLEGKTDDEGRFTIDELPVGTFNLNIGPSKEHMDIVPFGEAITIPAGPKDIERTFTLPRGMTIEGRVADKVTGEGVKGIELNYSPERQGVVTVFAMSPQTRTDGHYRVVVPAGKGTITIYAAVPQKYLAPGFRSVNQKPDPAFSRKVDGKSGDTIKDLNFTLDPGRMLTLRALDTDGKPVAGAEVKQYGFRPNAIEEPPPRTDAEGRVTVSGLDPNGTYDLDVIDRAGHRGMRFQFRPNAGLPTDRPIDVALVPLAAVEGRVLDEKDQPIQGVILTLRSDVRTPERLGVPILTSDELRPDGTFRIEDLVPGGSYNIEAKVEGRPDLNSPSFVASAGETQKLEPIRLPVTDVEVRGIVVDPRGQPVADATVSYDRSHDQRNFGMPSGTWFMDTGADGRFHLTKLPRGPLRLMVYRHPPQGHSIENLTYQDVKDPTAEIRVVLPDAEQRLQGIEE